MNNDTANTAPSSETAPFTVRWSRPEGERTEDLLILLHGYGANEDDLFGLVPHLPQRFTVAAVRAPMTLQPGGYAWFPLSQDPVTGEIGSDAASVRTAIEDLHAWVGAVREGFRTVSLLGFSQGMALATSLLRLDPTAYAATVALHGAVHAISLGFGMTMLGVVVDYPILLLTLRRDELA